MNDDSDDDEARRNRVVQKIARFFIRGGVDFNAIKLDSFKEMIDAIGECGPCLEPPSCHELKVPLLKKEIAYTEELFKENKDECEKFGCSIMVDEWTDKTGRTLINFLLNNAKGTMFLESVDASAYVKSGCLLFDLLDKFVERVGEKNVVQVITNNGSNYLLAGKLLERKRPHLLWTPCVSHAIDLMLEDISNIPIIKKTISKGIALVGFIYNYASVLAMMREFTGNKELVKHGVTRVATTFLTLQSLKRRKQDLRRMFLSEQWTSNRWSKNAMGYYLNPYFYYHKPRDFEVIRGFFICLEILVDAEEVRDKILKELTIYENSEGLFGNRFAIRARNMINEEENKMAPVDWWKMFGCSAPELMKFAVKILSLSCSGSSCERDRGIFEQLHSKKRIKIKQKRFRDLVYVKYNQTLKANATKKIKWDPIKLKNISSECDNEWLLGTMNAGDEKVFDDGLTSGAEEIMQTKKQQQGDFNPLAFGGASTSKGNGLEDQATQPSLQMDEESEDDDIDVDVLVDDDSEFEEEEQVSGEEMEDDE